MMKIRRALGMLLCVLLVIGIFPVSMEAGAEEYDGFLYEIHDGKATITGCTKDNLYVLDIPATIDGYPVTAIGAKAFQENNNLIQLILPEGVETIEPYAFCLCRNLQWVELPDSLLSIGKEAFYGNSSLEEVWFGNHLKVIDEGAFARCYKLDDILILPYQLERIGLSAFYDCNTIEQVRLPDSLKELGTKAFAMCDRLTYVTMPSNLEKLGADVFYETACYRSSYNWADNLFTMDSYLLDAKKTISGRCEVFPWITHIADEAFSGCSNMTEIILPENLKIIGSAAFQCCDGLKSIVIPSGVTTIADKAFYWCDNLSDIQIPNSVTYIGQEVAGRTAFYKNAENWENGVLYMGSCLVECKSTVSGALQIRPGTKTVIAGAMKEQKKLTELILPDSVTTIGENAFYGCAALKTIQLGKNVSRIGEAAFAQCTNLESINVHPENATYRSQNNCLIRIKDHCLVLGCKTSRIPEGGSVTGIGAFAFEGCDGLKELIVPDTILTIGEGAFRNCDYLTAVALGNGVQVVGADAFAECDVLCRIDLGQSVHTVADRGFAYNHRLSHVEFPASLRYLGEEAFSNSTGLVGVSFREGLVSIGKNCFAFCENLTALHLPDSLEEIKDGAFYTCEKLADVKLGEGLVNIGNSAFDGCKQLTALKIPGSVKVIGKSAFYDCKRLQTVDLGNVQRIGSSAFENCISLTQIHIPASVTEIGRQVFSYCNTMSQMTVSVQNPYYHSQGNCIIHTGGKYLAYGCKNSIIPDDGSVTAIDAYAFAGCQRLKSIVVPQWVSKIHAYAFYGCSGLECMELPFVGGESNYDNYLGYIFGGGPSQNDLFVPASLKRVVITGGRIVGDSAFSKCRGLQEIVLPESITSVGYGAFAKCDQLQKVILPGNLEKLKSSDILNESPLVSLYISANQENTVTLMDSYGIPYRLGGIITFQDDQGKLIDRVWHPFNATISTPEVPEKPADDRYTYETTWSPVPGYCKGNQTIQLCYIAHRIGGAVQGDLNGDDKINSLDGLMLMRYLNGWDVVITSPDTMDINGDGKVNSLDGLLLMRYLNGWNVTLG